MTWEKDLMMFVKFNHVHNKTSINFSTTLNNLYCLGTMQMMNY